METKRPDAIFRDPYAERLAGAQGQAIVDAMKRGRAMAWAMIVRTAVFDEIILERIRNGNVDVVVNLAAGLDARPWRMKLPPTLRWIDVDLPGILDHKTEIMKAEKPVCRVRGDSSRPRRCDAPAIIVLADQRRLATRARRIGRVGDLSEAGRRRVARPRPARRATLSMVGVRSRQSRPHGHDAEDVGPKRQIGQRTVSVRTGREHGFLPAVRMGGARIPLGDGGREKTSPPDAVHVVLAIPWPISAPKRSRRSSVASPAPCSSSGCSQPFSRIDCL